MSSSIRIAMLNADTPVPNVRPKWGTYGSMFHGLLVAAASRIAPNANIQSLYYDVQKFEYPESLQGVDALLVTGSASSSYDDLDWIRRLDSYVLDVYINHPRVKIFGSCFGHQLVCQSLLRGYGVQVEKDPHGWELGVHQIKIEGKFREVLGKTSRALLKPDYSAKVPESVRVQMIHSDHVRIPSPDALPKSWIMVGRTEQCAVQGVYEPNRILTLQGHFEFDRFISTEIMKLFGASWEPEVLKKTLEAIDADDDAEAAAEIVLQFLMEKEGSEGEATHHVIDGLQLAPFAE